MRNRFTIYPGVKGPFMSEKLTDELLNVAKTICCGPIVDLSNLLYGNDELTVSKQIDKLSFRYTDNSKPYFYHQAVFKPDGRAYAEMKRFTEKYKGLQYDFPYVTRTTPRRMVATAYDMFTVTEYTEVEESTTKYPDNEEVVNKIIEAVREFGLKFLPVQDQTTNPYLS